MKRMTKHREQVSFWMSSAGRVGIILGFLMVMGGLVGCGQDEDHGDDSYEMNGIKMDSATWNLACASLRNDSGAMPAMATPNPDSAENVGTAHETPVDLKLIPWSHVSKRSDEKGFEYGGYGSAGFHPDGMKFKIFFNKKVKVEFEKDQAMLTTGAITTFESGAPTGLRSCPEIAQVGEWHFPGGTFGMRFGPTSDTLVRFVWIEDGHRH